MRNGIRALVICIVATTLPPNVAADGGYFSETHSVAQSADQQAIIIQSGNSISATFRTAYAGNGEAFAWIIPTPALPVLFSVRESDEDAFAFLDELTAPEVTTGYSGGCFPAGTLVHTVSGLKLIESIEPDTGVYTWNMTERAWRVDRVLRRTSQSHAGSMITIRVGDDTVSATPNHPFFVCSGEGLEDRPVPGDIGQDAVSNSSGRWVEAADLRVGDELLSRDGRRAFITAVARRSAQVEVYNLIIDAARNYAVGQPGLLVHNKGGAEEGGEAVPLVNHYGTVALEHYEVSVLGAAAGKPLVQWLQRHEYQVTSDAVATLDWYIDRGWSFVAVKLNPYDQSISSRTLLPPITIEYESDRIVFPLRISAVSTSRPVEIALYVIADSTVSTSNIPCMHLPYEKVVTSPIDPEMYLLERRIAAATDRPESGCVILWSGRIGRSLINNSPLRPLSDAGRWPGRREYLTRLQLRVSPDQMTDDIYFEPDLAPVEFDVRFSATESLYSALCIAAEAGEAETVEALVGHGLNPEVRDEYDHTPLMLAARNGNSAVVRELLAAGAHPSAGDKGDNTALSEAAERGDVQQMRILIEAATGRDTYTPDQLGRALVQASSAGTAEAARVLLEAGASPQGTDALYSAAAFGHGDIVTVLVAAGADVDEKGPSYQLNNRHVPLIAAVSRGHLESARVLLEAGAKYDATDHSGRDAFAIAAQDGWAELAALLLETIVERAGNASARETLLAALVRGNKPEVERLLEGGTPVDSRLRYELTPLICSAMLGHTDIADYLLEHGADVDATDRFGNTALMCGAGGGYPDIAATLLEHGADVHAATPAGRTALWRAVSAGSCDLVAMLLNAGANTEIRAGWLETPLIVRAAATGQPTIVEALINSGADIEATDSRDRSALWWAILNRRTDVVAMLANAGAAVSPEALCIAASSCRTPVVVALLQAGADPNAGGDWVFETPVLAAAASGCLEVVEELVRAGADINVVDSRGQTALDLAGERCQLAVIEYLLAAGAEPRPPSRWNSLALTYCVPGGP